jgi:hypothetical protein
MVYVNTASSYRKMKRKSLADFTEFVSVKISDTAIVNCNLKYISIAILITHSRPIRLHFRFWSFPILILCLLFHKSDLAIVGELKLKLFFRALLNIKYKVKTLQCFFKHVVPENFPQNICCSSTTDKLTPSGLLSEANTLLHTGYRCSSPEVKWLKREADQSLPSANVKKTWIYAPTPPYVFMKLVVS